MYICDKDIEGIKNTVSTLASGVKEGDTIEDGHQGSSLELSMS